MENVSSSSKKCSVNVLSDIESSYRNPVIINILECVRFIVSSFLQILPSFFPSLIILITFLNSDFFLHPD